MTESDSFELTFEDVAPFPAERFLAFVSHLKVQSNDAAPRAVVCTENLIRVDDVIESTKLGE